MAITAATMATMSTYAAAASAALGMASAYSQNQMANAQIEAKNRQIEMDNQAAVEQMADNYAALNTEAQKAAKESVQQGEEVQKAGIQERSRINLLAASTGMGGASVEDMFFAVNRDEAKSMSNVIGNYEDRIYEINQNAENVWNQAKGGLRSTLNKPSGWSKAANILQGTLSGYAAGSSIGKSLDAMAPAKKQGSGLFSQQAAPIVKMGI